MAVDANVVAPSTSVGTREGRKPNYNKLVPLIYAPTLPLLRLALQNRVRPGTRDKIFGVAVLTALVHAGYVMSGDSTMGGGT